MPESDDALRAEFRELTRDPDALPAAANRYIDLVKSGIGDTLVDFEWDTTTNTDLLRRGVLARTVSSYEAALTLASTSFSAEARALLRPVCEDLIFVSWLESLEHEVASQFILRKAMADGWESAAVQNEFLPKLYSDFSINDAADAPGLTFSDVATENRDGSATWLEQFCKNQGKTWRKTGPSVFEMARVGGTLDVYRFFYHATSKSVHSNTHEIMRTIWGNPSNMRFSVDRSKLKNLHRLHTIIYGCWLVEEILDRMDRYFKDISNLRATERYVMLYVSVIGTPAKAKMLPPLIHEREMDAPDSSWREAPPTVGEQGSV